MQIMKVKLDYKIIEAAKNNPDTDIPSPQGLTLEYITQAVLQKHKDGLDGSLRRMWGRIQRKFDAAIDGDLESIELDQNEADFIKRCFDEAKYSAIIARYIQVLEDEINSWPKQ